VLVFQRHLKHSAHCIYTMRECSVKFTQRRYSHDPKPCTGHLLTDVRCARALGESQWWGEYHW